MPGVSSTTGLIAARVRPVYRPHQKRVELSGSTRPAPFTLRPFAGLFNPYPYGCSVLCNHPADCDAKEFVRRAKESWATEGKALLLPAEMELIRATLLAGGGGGEGGGCGAGGGCGTLGDPSAVPEELFRRYTETDSRPLTPAPTLASGPPLTHRLPDSPAPCYPRERTTLVLDLRANSQNQETETLSWHALSLEPAPSPRKSEISVPRPTIRQPSPSSPAQPSPSPSPSPSQPPPVIDVSDASSSKNAAGDGDSSSEEPPLRRRGKRLRKRKCRRGSTYGQQTEVRDPPEPLETQVSQVDDGSRCGSEQPSIGEGGGSSPPTNKSTTPPPEHVMPPSFIDANILKHLGRELDREMVEAEFSIKRRIALEEALRVKCDLQSEIRTPRQAMAEPSSENVPRVFSRQSARFEIPLDSRILGEMTPLDYVSRHVFVTEGRKLMSSRVFNRYFEETSEGIRHILPKDIQAALEEVMGRPLTEEQLVKFKTMLGNIDEPLNFRTWCGVCAAAERLLMALPAPELDPPAWIEKADLEGLERRLRSIEADPRLVLLLREVRDR